MNVPAVTLAALVLSGAPTPLAAQWLNYPTPGIPRAADGKPDLSAAAPRTPDGKPDLSGLWGKRGVGKYYWDIAPDVKPGEVQLWVETLFQRRSDDLGKDSMETRCLPMGPAFSTIPFHLVKIVQTPALILMLSEDLTYRQIFMDGRPLEKDPNPSWMGYSVGHWDGDTLVVDSSGFNDQSWLDFRGHAHTEALRITERYRRTSVGRMELQLRLDDPQAYSKPLTVAFDWNLEADSELLEFVCTENERDRSHLVGKASDDRKAEVKVAAEILRNYVGVYEIGPWPVEIKFSGSELVLDSADGAAPLIPVSDTRFLVFGTLLEFFRDDRGVVTHFVRTGVGIETKAVRKR